QAEDLLHDAEVHLPVIAGHAGGSVDEEDDVFAVERNAADVRRARALSALRGQALHLLGEGLLPGHELALDDVGDRGILAAAGVAALDAAEIAGEARELAALALEGLATPHELAVELIGLPADYVQLLLEEPHLAAQVLAALLEHRGLADRGQHQQEDHGAEAAADRVQEREGEYLEAAAPAHYGQSFDGMSSVPPVTQLRGIHPLVP